MKEHRKLVHDLAELVDLDAGLREVLAPARHEALTEAVADVVDVEAGLAAILPPMPDDFWHSLAGVDPRRRLAARRHPAVVELRRWSELLSRLRTFRQDMLFGIGASVAGHIDRLAATGRDVQLESLLVEAATHARASEHLDARRTMDRAVIRAQELWQAEADRMLAALGLPEGAYSASIVTYRLAEFLNDLRGADLRDVDLTGIPLEGVRWSSTTRWPIDWVDRIERMSVQIGPGLYEIRRGTTRQDSFTR